MGFRGKPLKLSKGADVKHAVRIVLALSLLAAPLFAQSSTCYPPSVCYTYSPNIMKAGKPITFNAGCSSDPDGTIVSYHWDFGDGTTATGVSPVHTYAVSGGYSITLTVTDNQGYSSGFEDYHYVHPDCGGLSTCWQ